MLTIYKYQLDINDVVEIFMPQHTRILDIQVQYGIPCIWAVVDTEQPKVTRRFRIFGTGQPMDRDYTNFIGAFQLQNGSRVFHVFEESIHSLNK
jgi:hypothetical protein